jgi:hypothetical protein
MALSPDMRAKVSHYPQSVSRLFTVGKRMETGVSMKLD